MPNYVYSTLSLSGSAEDIKNFREKFEEEGKLRATNVIPYPKEFDLLDKKGRKEKLTPIEERELTLIGLEGKYNTNRDGFNQGGYDWCCINWGTKWGFCDCSVDEEEDDFLSYGFETAWSPITPVIFEMSRQFPNVEFTYFCDEEGGAFRFEEIYNNGIVTECDDQTDDIAEERRQEEEDWQLEQERDRQIEAKMEEKNG